jgi:hypothetical protein
MQKKSKFKKCQPKATYILCNLDPNQTLYHYTKLKQNSRGKKHDLNRLEKKRKINVTMSFKPSQQKHLEI